MGVWSGSSTVLLAPCWRALYTGGEYPRSRSVPNSPEDKRKAIARLRRIQGQAAALERAIDEGSPCARVLQQIAALRGAVNGLMSEVLESHLRETFEPFAAAADDPDSELDASIEDAVKLVHTYLK